MAKLEIHVYSAMFAPWEEGADERERVDEDTDHKVFDNARECADWLEREGFGVPSESRPFGFRTWLNECDPREDDWGVLTERSAHPVAGEFHPRLWAAVVACVSEQKTWPYWEGRERGYQ
jgi:hypothetical protein